MRQRDVHLINDPPGVGQHRDFAEHGDFEAFVRAAEPVLRRALVAAYGSQDGREAAADALAYAWEHWDRVSEMRNAVGYLFLVARSSVAKSRRRWRRAPAAFEPPAAFEVPGAEHPFEPGLPAALAALSERQRIAVVLGVGFGYPLREIAELTGTKVTTVQNHRERGLRRLRERLGAQAGGNNERQ